MNYPSKSKVNVAVSNNNKFDLSRQVVTTHDFGRVKPIECRYMVPGDKFNYKISSFTRLLPMVSPTFGKIDTIQRAYFVPIRTIKPEFYDWISNQPVAAGGSGQYSSLNIIPSTDMHSFVQAFVGNKKFMEVVTGSSLSPSQYDVYCDYNGNDVIHNIDDWSDVLSPGNYYKFTSEGRKLYDFFVSMGLNISFEKSYKDVQVSLLPILSFWKAYTDWVVPSRYVKDYPVQLKNILKFFNMSLDGYEEYWSSQSVAKEMEDFFMHYPLSFYQNDYFNSAWLYPFNEQNLSNDISIPNPDNYLYSFSPVEMYVNENLGSTASNSYDFINYFTIESLGKLQDYLNRGMLAGSKVQDWLLAEFGIRPSTDALNLSTYLGKMSDTIRIGDITSSADTAAQGGQLLGAYAGRAMGGSTGTFEYSAREHGYFIITTEIIPKTSYTQGLTPEFSMIDRFDFFEGAFDNMGVQAIARKELFCSPRKDNVTQSMDPEKIFGFAPRYANLKCAFDTISGDFRTCYGEYLKSWYLNRDVEKFLVESDANRDGVIDYQFTTVNSDLQNWQNIFAYTDDDIDHFYQIFVIENSASRPMLSISDALNPEHPNGNKEVTIKTHGGVE